MQSLPSRLKMAWPVPSWHRIFYDLAFVSIFLVLSTSYSVDHSLRQSVWLVIVFSVLWAIWLLTSVVERGAPMGVMRIGLLLVQMAILLIAAISADTTVEDTSLLFSVLVGVAMLVILTLDAIARSSVLCVIDRTLLAASAVTSMLAALDLGAWELLVWLASLVLLGVVAVRIVRNRTAGLGDHLRHRLGELTIIALGETFLKIGLAADEKTLNEYSWMVLSLIFALITTCWWAYFTVPSVSQMHDSGRPSGRWIAAHLPFHLAVAALAVGLGKMLTTGSKLDTDGLGDLILGPMALLCLALAGMVTRRVPTRMAIAYGTAGLVLTGMAVWVTMSKKVDSKLVTAIAFGVLVAATTVAALRRPDRDAEILDTMHLEGESATPEPQERTDPTPGNPT